MTQWVGEAWKSIHQELQLTIQRSFRKCGTTEDDQINIRGLQLDNYQIPRSIDLCNAEDPPTHPTSPTPQASDSNSDPAVSLEEEIID